MSKIINLKTGVMTKHVNAATKAIRDGYIIAIPLEHHYGLVCDAFSHDAVREMHVLRGDDLGIAAQVLLADVKTASGVAREVTPSLSALMKKFWPGMLSLNLKPQLGLNWDLGDNGELDLVSLRVPRSKFIRDVLKNTGPLAVASASLAGMPPLRKISEMSVLESGVILRCDAGLLKKGSPTTILEAQESGLRIMREGAISLAEIRAIAPEVSAQL
jgi:tRNA threonylcarbamoyl adenosine modification protein (Sua5/YciO/YrdC/YwlC family)